MNSKSYFNNIYDDFFKVESLKLDVKEKKEDIKKDKDVFLKEIFDKINKLYLNDEDKDLLKNITQYMRKYNEKIEENYINFNMSFITNNNESINNLHLLISSAAIYFDYVKNNDIVISFYDIPKIEDVKNIFDKYNIITFTNINVLEKYEQSYIDNYFHLLKNNIKEGKIIIICGSDSDLKIFFSHSNLKDFSFNFEIKEIKPDIQDIYNNILLKCNLSDDNKIKLLDYITQTFPKTNLDPLLYENKLISYISFNKKLPSLEVNKSMEEIFKELNELVGLDNIKKTLYDLVDLITLKNKTKGELKINDINLHMLFLGNPGTGKTTVARIIAQILYNLKYIKENKLIEVTSKDLVAEYVGQTAPKTNAVIEKALGGVLFIDEAYALASKDNNSSYNAEAIATLIAAMENHRDNLVVIFAGYTKEMQDFIDSNSGIASRIGYTLIFNDYTPDELVKIFKLMATKSGFIIKEDVYDKIKEIINEYKDTKNFGNARFIRNLFEKTVIKHASNTKSNKRKDILKTITKNDLSTDNLFK